jgi:hypothetical protein
MNVKHIAATLAILGSASFTLTGCKKSGEGTEVPAEGEKKAEGSCGANKDGSCNGEKKEGDAAAPAEGDAAAAPPAEGG